MTTVGQRVLTRFRAISRRCKTRVLPAQLRKVQVQWDYPDGPDRLVPSPVFLFSPSRSGSTLLRSILNSHSQVCAPHEMHLNRLDVTVTKKFARAAMDDLGLTELDLENLLWDRVLHRQLVISRKSIVVDKTPHNVIFWQRIADAWPRARYLYLIRHPAAIVQSHAEARPQVDTSEHVNGVLGYARHIAEAREQLPGHLVRYEDLVTRPEEVTRAICSSLGVRWERTMLEYGRFSRDSHRRQGTGDWSDNIRSGAIQPLRPPPETPPELADLAAKWGY